MKLKSKESFPSSTQWSKEPFDSSGPASLKASPSPAPDSSSRRMPLLLYAVVVLCYCLRRLKRELVPKAQTMSYFDRPFVPKRSEKPYTIPKEPRFRIHPRKSSCASRFK